MIRHQPNYTLSRFLDRLAIRPIGFRCVFNLVVQFIPFSIVGGRIYWIWLKTIDLLRHLTETLHRQFATTETFPEQALWLEPESPGADTGSQDAEGHLQTYTAVLFFKTEAFSEEAIVQNVLYA